MAIRPRELELVTIAHDIREWIVKEHGKECPYERANPMPNFRSYQTDKGLVLERERGWPNVILTPVGLLRIWDVVDENHYFEGSLVTNELKITLNVFALCDHKLRDCYSITQWKGQRIEDPTYRANSFGETQVHEIWMQVTKPKRSFWSKLFNE